jgi:poly [ADP-ribose] polymerase
MDIRKLVFVSENNNNKYIDVYPIENGEFKVDWGRIGAKGTSTVYPAWKYESYIESKLDKGYQEITDYQMQETHLDTSKIPSKIRLLVDDLLQSARTKISHSYISTDGVSERQIDKAQDILDYLNGQRRNRLDINSINSSLKELYAILPRKMANTRDHFLKYDDKGFFTELLQKEQDLLNTLRGQVSLGNSEQISLSKAGIKITVATKADRERLAKETDFIPGHKKIWKVVNKETEKNFNPKGLATRLLAHGSTTDNYWSILTTGLKIRPAGVPTTGSMFSNGCYWGLNAKKSIGYTSLRGSRYGYGTENHAYLLYFEVATGKPWYILGRNGQKQYEDWMGYAIPSKLASHKADSVWAKAGLELHMDEIITYNTNQSTIRYIIEITR